MISKIDSILVTVYIFTVISGVQWVTLMMYENKFSTIQITRIALWLYVSAAAAPIILLAIIKIVICFIAWRKARKTPKTREIPEIPEIPEIRNPEIPESNDPEIRVVIH